MKAGQLPIPVRQSSDPRILDAIDLPAVRMAVWERSLPLCFSQWIDAIPAAKLPSGRVMVDVQRIRPALAHLCEAVSMLPHPMRTWLIDDVTSLAQGYARRQALAAVDIRLEAVDGDACWRFHRDNVALRLLTTYRGPGTEWVTPEVEDMALASQRGFTGPVQHLTRGTVALMKGSRLAADDGILHRSPPVRGHGITRLMLAINAPSDASPDAMG